MKRRFAESIAVDVGWLMLLAGTCCFLGSWITFVLGGESRLVIWALAALLNLIGGLPILSFAKRFQSRALLTAVPILIAGWRMLILLIAVVIARATKWPNLNLFVIALMGCYFPFLVLESLLSVRRIRMQSPRIEPVNGEHHSSHQG